MTPGWKMVVLFCAFSAAVSLVMGPVLSVQQQQDSDKIEDVAQQNRVLALKLNNSPCALRADLETRVATSEEFIKDHPEGFAGISVEEIERGLANQRSTIEALSDLNC